MRDTTFSTRIPTISQMLPISNRQVLLARIMQWPREGAYAAFDQAYEAGCYDTIIAETDKEYEKGEVLSKLP